MVKGDALAKQATLCVHTRLSSQIKSTLYGQRSACRFTWICVVIYVDNNVECEVMVSSDVQVKLPALWMLLAINKVLHLVL